MRPRRILLAAGLAVSFVLCLGVGALLETVDPVLLTVPQLESVAEAPVLGSVPHMS